MQPTPPFIGSDPSHTQAPSRINPAGAFEACSMPIGVLHVCEAGETQIIYNRRYGACYFKDLSHCGFVVGTKCTDLGCQGMQNSSAAPPIKRHAVLAISLLPASCQLLIPQDTPGITCTTCFARVDRDGHWIEYTNTDPKVPLQPGNKFVHFSTGVQIRWHLYARGAQEPNWTDIARQHPTAVILTDPNSYRYAVFTPLSENLDPIPTLKLS